MTMNKASGAAQEQKNQIEKVMEGKSIYLRRILFSDANDTYYKWLNDVEIIQFLEVRHADRSLDKIKEYIKSVLNNPNEHFFAICLNDSNQHIGNIKLGPVDPIHKFAHIGLFIGEKKQWGKGLATEAIQLVTDYGFNVLKLNKIMAGCYANNPGSKKAFEKAGYVQEGVERLKWLYQDGKYVDGILMGIVNERGAIK